MRCFVWLTMCIVSMRAGMLSASVSESESEDGSVLVQSLETFLSGDPAIPSRDEEDPTASTKTAFEKLQKMLESGLITQAEFDEGSERLKFIQDTMDLALDRSPRRMKEIKCSADQSLYEVPHVLFDYERPHAAEKRASEDWEGIVESEWCKQDDSGSPENYKAQGLSHQETKCAICENFFMRLLIGDIVKVGTCPELEEEVNMLSLLRCDIGTHRSDASIPSNSFGDVQFSDTFEELCKQFRREFSMRMSPREVLAWQRSIESQCRDEWDRYELVRDKHRCFHDLGSEIASRMCVDAACCPRSLVHGCPFEAMVCTQCREVLEPTLDAPKEPKRISFQEIDRELYDGYLEWLREDAMKVVSEIEALQKEENLIEDYIYAFRTYFRPRVASVLAQLHPAIDCPRIRKAVNLEITRRARKIDPKCVQPKEFMWRRNSFGRMRGRKSCLDIYRKSNPDICSSIVDDALMESVLRLKGAGAPATVTEWNREHLGALPHSLRRTDVPAEMTMQCCRIVVESWSDGSDGKKVAEATQDDWKTQMRHEVRDMIQNYRSVMVDLHQLADRDGRRPSNGLTDADVIDRTLSKISPEKIRELHSDALNEFDPFWDRLDEIELSMKELVRVQARQKHREGVVEASLRKPYRTSKEVWDAIKSFVALRAAREKAELTSAQTSSDAEKGLLLVQQKRKSGKSKGILGWGKTRAMRVKPIPINEAFWATRPGKSTDEKVEALCADVFPGLCTPKAS